MVFVMVRNASRFVGSNEVLVWLASLAAFWVSARFSWWIVPSCSLPQSAWPVFIVSHLFSIWVWIRLFALARGDVVLPSLRLVLPTITLMVC